MREVKFCKKKQLELCLWLILFFVWFIIYFLNGFFFGYRATFVLTGSMEPQIPIASLLIEKKYDRNEHVLQKGDIITFLVEKDDSTFRVTHRITQIKGSRLYTKGDANSEVDDFQVYDSDVESTVIFIYPYFFSTISAFVILGIIAFQLINRYKYLNEKDNDTK